LRFEATNLSASANDAGQVGAATVAFRGGLKEHGG
jgi:hypothetical protein